MYRVMIVEDDDIIAGTVKKHLEQWQYDVHIASGFVKCYGRIYRLFTAHCSYGYKTSILQWLSLVQ